MNLITLLRKDFRNDGELPESLLETLSEGLALLLVLSVSITLEIFGEDIDLSDLRPEERVRRGITGCQKIS